MSQNAELTAVRYLIVAGTAEVVSAKRILSDGESAYLEGVVRRLGPRRSLWRWSAKEDQALKAFIRRRAKNGRPKPFQPNDEVRLLAASMGRTYMAVHRRIERLRKRMKCSDATKARKRRVR